MTDASHSHPISRWMKIILTIHANVIFLILWAGFAIAMTTSPESIDRTWEWFKGLPLPIAIVVWAVLLPIPVALWIHESSWPTMGRYAGYTGIIAWTCLALSGLAKLIRGKQTVSIFFDNPVENRRR